MDLPTLVTDRHRLPRTMESPRNRPEIGDVGPRYMQQISQFTSPIGEQLDGRGMVVEDISAKGNRHLAQVGLEQVGALYVGMRMQLLCGGWD